MLALTLGCFMLPLVIMIFCYWQAKVVLHKPSAFNSASTNEANIKALNADWVNQKEITTVCNIVVVFSLFYNVLYGINYRLPSVAYIVAGDLYSVVRVVERGATMICLFA